MKKVLNPIAFNEASYNVALLHKILQILDFPVAKEEVAQSKAGSNTLKQVRALQARLNVPAPTSVLVDDSTLAAIKRALDERDLLTASRSFTITGAVKLATGAVRKRQRLLAFSLNLHGVAVYRNIKELVQIKKEQGFEFLGETDSDVRGHYTITFYDWQNEQVNQKKAVVMIYALEGEKIAGFTSLINIENYADSGLVRNADIIVQQDKKGTEYEVMTGKVNAFLRANNTSLMEISKSEDQLAFAAGELEVELPRVRILANSESMTKEILKNKKKISTELLYGIGRQNINLSWHSVYKKSEDELHSAIDKSIDEGIIQKIETKAVENFIRDLNELSIKHILHDPQPNGESKINSMLSYTLPEDGMRISFLKALKKFKGSDFRAFWNEHLPSETEFQDKPHLISGLLLTQQLTLLTGDHQILVKELQVIRKLTSLEQLFGFENDDWLEMIKKTGVPSFVEGNNDEDRINKYILSMKNLLNAAFPTQRIAKMIERNELPIEKTRIANHISTFLSQNRQFSFAGSRVYDFENEIKMIAGDDFQGVRSELMKIQRVFQVSTDPDAMIVLMENNLHSAYTIANIPRKSFIQTYGKSLGGENVAFAIHQRASHIGTKAEMNAMNIKEYSHDPMPKYIMDESEYNSAKTILQKNIPNYSELFGSPDICECEHCRSVLSPAAYFVELLRFLWRGTPNDEGKTPLKVLADRRPDLMQLSLTCENTNTLIPYIDLVNEVMEYYAAKESLSDFEGYDTGDTSAEELRANPQNFSLEAYRKLKDAKYPFSLPYHQPLDVIRVYSDHLNVSRYEALKAMNPQPDASTERAIEAESLYIAPEEYIILTGKAFDDTPDFTLLHEYFGYKAEEQNKLDELSQVREFLKRSGVEYIDLVELVKTRFINPYQSTLIFLEKVFSFASIDARSAYEKLKKIAAGTLDPADDPQIVEALKEDNGSSITTHEFAQWVIAHFNQFRQVITLYEPESKCDLGTTRLKTIQSVYEGSSDSGISNSTWSKLHRFIRLWRKLGWTIHEVDLMLTAMGDEDITAETISKLETVILMSKLTKCPLNQQAALWGSIDSSGDRSLYRKLFLNKAVQQIDKAFEADAWGNYLQDQTEILADHRSAIRAAFRLTEEELSVILTTAKVIDENRQRSLDMDSDILNIQNLSTIYRYVVLAKALKIQIVDLCKLISLFKVSPFSILDIQQGVFTHIAPSETYKFCELAISAKKVGFKSSTLEYILKGVFPADSNIALDENKTRLAAKAFRDSFLAIEQILPDTSTLPLTIETVSAKLSLTFQSNIVNRFMRMIDGKESFETITDTNLTIAIPDSFSGKFTYIKGSGRLMCLGITTDDEKSVLTGLNGANVNFQAAVEKLYRAPETFIADNFNCAFTNLSETYAILLNHPQSSTPASLDMKLAYVYESFLPLLRNKLRQDTISQNIASLIGLSKEAAALLIADDINKLISDLSIEGFSATYFSDSGWNNSVLERFDSTIDFAWGNSAPDPLVPADNFSARWKAYIATPASGEYTLVVDVEEADEIFRLYLDDTLILEKTSANSATSLEVVTYLNSAQLHLLSLEYAEFSQNAGIRLRWKAATKALEIIPASVTYPAKILDEFVARATVLHRAAKFILGFEISETELNHLIRFNTDFGDINCKALSEEHWKRINAYVSLRNKLPQAQALLTDVFALANVLDPAPTIDGLVELLHLASAWDKTSLGYLVTNYFNLSADDFKNEISITWLCNAMEILSRTGIPVQTLVEWGVLETDFDLLYGTAQLIKNAVKAKYENEDWLNLAGTLSNKIREDQKQALISYLLTLPTIQELRVDDADSLYEYLLIDVQMSACMDTSRIVQASAAIQMFVNRCLLNMESGVSPESIDKDRWEWMKNYRVWEANRKVFLYPENWLEPEWRNDRSEFFKELESYLAQNDITERTVEQASRNYLMNLNEVANLDVCGMYQEDDNGDLKCLHVFARTHNAPYKFFYRRWNEFRKWSAWEKIQLDIRSVENGDNSGVHLIPIVWKKRLFLFWPEFMKTQEKPSNGNQSVADVSNVQMSELEPDKFWEIRLAWSEYAEGKWTPKQVSKEFIKLGLLWYVPNESEWQFSTFVSKSSIYIYIGTRDYADPSIWCLRGLFKLSDIESKVVAINYSHNHRRGQWYKSYSYDFMKVSSYGTLNLQDNTYLEIATIHKLLLSAHYSDLDPSFQEPFFFFSSDQRRTYFVRPVSIAIIEGLSSPEVYVPYSKALLAPVMNKNTRSGDPNTFLKPLMTDTGQVAIEKNDAEIIPSVNGMMGATQVGNAFGGAANEIVGVVGGWDKGLEFHTFYHPYSSEYVARLNQWGMPGLMESDTTLPSDEGSTFEKAYNPNLDNGLVQKPDDFNKYTYYKENVSFDVYGANSPYEWELFFHIPLYVAIRLSKNGKFEEALKWFHYIFDPTTDEISLPGESEISRYWKVLPFKTTPAQRLEDWFRELSPNTDPATPGNAMIDEWRKNPFDPHLVASNRSLAYMKYVVIKYVENLVAWGDALFRRFTRESVNEALQIYVIAKHVLGPRPEFVPKRGEIKAESYESLKNKWDDFSNALVELENIFPYSSRVSISSTSTGTNLLGIGSSLYFCIPANDKLMQYWDTVDDRLFKIRHCQDIEGAEHKLALFAPPIEPSLLIQAASQGLDLGSILADLSSPPPIYRFPYLIQKANEFCADVMALGSSLLAAMEKRDAEELSLLRASHETQMLDLMMAVRERQLFDAKLRKENLEKTRKLVELRFRHYLDLLGNDSITPPPPPTISETLTAESQLPADTNIATIKSDVDTALIDSDERGVKLIAREASELALTQDASDDLDSSFVADMFSGFMGLIPQFSADGKPLGVGAGTGFGGRELSWFAGSMAKMFKTSSETSSLAASKSAKMASYIRREQDWTLQANLASREIIQIDKQITSADIGIQVADKELGNHKKQIENAKAVENFLKNKFSKKELYQWMKEQLFAVYKQSYNLAYEMAKKAEIAYRFETGSELTNFINYGYWDNSKEGLVASEKLHLALRQLEKSYLEDNRRELELTKSISLARLNPLALIELRETGKCFVSLPEELFDLDFRGHYFRRIKAVRLSIPCVAGPYTSINCTLRLLNNTIRINTAPNKSEGKYEHENYEGLWIDDTRFRTNYTPITSIATSSAQNDSGMFEFNFRDERYLPFELVGVISEWQLELATDKELRSFDYSTISDVILHINYTARESGGSFKKMATTYMINDFLMNQPLMQLYSMKHEFPSEWYKFLHPSTVGAEQILTFTLGKEYFPFFVQDRDVITTKIEVFAKSSQETTYDMILSNRNISDDLITSGQIAMQRNSTYNGLNTATIGANDAGLNLEEMDITKEISLKLKRNTAADYTELVADPPEVVDIFFVIHYKLG